jgi:transcriptional regulator with XRE-family HTH domain
MIEQLRARCRAIGITAEQLAKRAGVSQRTCHTLIAGGEFSPNLATLEAITAAVGMRLDVSADITPDAFRMLRAREKAARVYGGDVNRALNEFLWID